MYLNRNGTRAEIRSMSNSTPIRRLIVAGTLVVGLRKTLTHLTKLFGEIVLLEVGLVRAPWLDGT
jgi:hypothetical protein